MLREIIKNIELSETIKDILPLFLSIFCFIFFASISAIRHKRNNYYIFDFIKSSILTSVLYFLTIKVLGLQRLDYLFDGFKYIYREIVGFLCSILFILINSKYLLGSIVLVLCVLNSIVFFIEFIDLTLVYLFNLKEEFKYLLNNLSNKTKLFIYKIINLHIDLRVNNCLFSI